MDKDLMQNQETAETVVGPSVKIQGDLNSEGNIVIEGQVMGKVVTTQSVFIKNSAKITADISAGNAVVGGEVQGNLKISGHLTLEAAAKINGDIACNVLRVEDGALFTGKCNMKSASVANGKKTIQPSQSSVQERELEPEE